MCVDVCDVGDDDVLVMFFKGVGGEFEFDGVGGVLEDLRMKLYEVECVVCESEFVVWLKVLKVFEWLKDVDVVVNEECEWVVKFECEFEWVKVLCEEMSEVF